MNNRNRDNFNLSRPFNILTTVIVISMTMAYIDWYFVLPYIHYPKMILASLLSLYILIGFAIGALLAILLSLVIPFFKKNVFLSKRRFFLNYLYSKIIILLISVLFVGSVIYIFTYEENEGTYYFPQKQLVRNKKNVILITVDNLRNDRLGCYGYDKDTTPFIDGIAEKGIVFENCISQSPNLLSSYISLFTSKYPVETKKKMPEDALTMAKLLSGNGYLTTGFAASSYLDLSSNLNQGFDYYNDNIPPFVPSFFDKLSFINFFRKIGLIKKDNAIRIMNNVLIPICNRIHGESFTENPGINIPVGKNAKEVNSVVFRWLNDYSEFSFFMFINYFDLHMLHDASQTPESSSTQPFKKLPDEYGNAIRVENLNEESIKNLHSIYDEKIRFIDSEIEKLFTKIETLGLMDKTIIIITSSSGKAFGEHGFIGNGKTLYNEVIDVPLIIYAPWLVKSQTRIDRNVELIDLIPTVAEIVSLEQKENFAGNSLIPLLDGGDIKSFRNYSESRLFSDPYPSSKDYPYSMTGTAIIKDNFKLIYNLEEENELYDLKNDPRELNNIINSQKELAESYKQILGSIN